MKLTNSFTLSLLGLAALAAMFLAKGLDTSGAIVTLCLGYITARVGQKYGISTSLAKDPNSSVGENLDKLKD